MQEDQRHVSSLQEAGLLDLLAVLAENSKLLILGPLLAGLCALGISFLVPSTFQSVAVLQAEQPMASLMVTAAVLDPVIASMDLADGLTVEEARTKLREQVKAAVGRSDKLLTLTVSGRTAQQTQALANAILKQTYQESRPKGRIRERLETQLIEAKSRLKNAQDASAGVLRRLEANGSGGGIDLARGYAELLSATGAAQTQVSTLEAQLDGLSEAHLVQAPTLPQKATHPKKGLIAIGATLAAALALLVFVLVRHSLLKKPSSEDNSLQWVRIRKSFGLK